MSNVPNFHQASSWSLQWWIQSSLCGQTCAEKCCHWNSWNIPINHTRNHRCMEFLARDVWFCTATMGFLPLMSHSKMFQQHGRCWKQWTHCFKREKHTHKFKAIHGVPVPMMPTLFPCKVFPDGGAGGIWTPSKPLPRAKETVFTKLIP